MKLSGQQEFWDWTRSTLRLRLQREPRTAGSDPYFATHWVLEEAFLTAVERRGKVSLELPEFPELLRAMAWAFLLCRPEQQNAYRDWLLRCARICHAAEARNPDTSPERLEFLARIQPAAVEENPMTSLVALESPEVFEKLQRNLERGQAARENQKTAAKRAATRRYLKKYTLE